ncbi:uncharacterized protein C18orf63 homolog [Brachyistius frenatus]|uniref:uncharacterized protein C18orf63 homolog n=1 Tax=Brachyistius frenatus TaxID=100188 RepID=UPI0037E948E4
MSGGQQSLLLLGLPDLKKMLCVGLSLQPDAKELRSRQIKTCRELVLLYSDILASPALDSFTDITAVMAISFFQRGVLQAFGRRRSLQLGHPQPVFPGKDFLTESGRLNAVRMELSTSNGQLCISIEASSVRLPPTALQDFELSPLVLRRFCSDLDSILDPASTGGAFWCHVLPSMKKGQIVAVSRQLPRDGPFRTYRDLQNHWNHLYGYRLPEMAEEDVVYCSVYFRLVGERLFTYPLSCIRLQPLQRCAQDNLQGAPGSFLSDVRDHLQSVCGFPARLTTKPCYHTVALNTAASVQMLNGEQVNLTSSSSSSIRPVLTQLPAPPPSQPVRSSFRSQPPAWTPLSQQPRSNIPACGGRMSQSQGCRGDGGWPSSSSSFSVPSIYQSAPPLPSSSASSSLQVFQPASTLTSSISSSSLLTCSISSSSSLLTCSISSSVLPPPKLLPIFKNKHPSRHVNVALLRLQKQKEQLGGGVEGRGRVTLPAFGRKTPTAASPFSSLPICPPPAVPRFVRPPKPPLAPPTIKHISSLSPSSKLKPGLIFAPKPAIKLKFKSGSKTVTNSGGEVKEKPAKQTSAAPSSPADAGRKDASTSSKKRVAFQLKSKRSRAAVRDVDVEEMARSNQLSQLNSATLSAWLRARGGIICAKLKKEELMLKVMSCLAEA